MKILVYHEKLHPAEQDILERASQRKHMLKKTWIWDFLLLISMSIGGMLLYLFSPVLMQISILAVFVPVQNSVWENLKLLFFPAFLMGLLRYLVTGNLQKGILTTYMQGILLSCSVMLSGHYIIAGILGKNLFLTDMVLFYLSVILLVWHLRTYADKQKKSSLPGFVILVLMAVCFIYLTYHIPPVIGLFQEINLSPQ